MVPCSSEVMPSQKLSPSRFFCMPVCALIWLLQVGCGGFSSGGAPGIAPPPPPEFSNPESQGEVKGQILVAASFLAELAQGLPIEKYIPNSEEENSEPSADSKAKAAPQKTRRSASDGPLGAVDVYSAMEVTLKGVRRQREAEVAGDGSFAVKLLPRGEYRVIVRLAGRELASFPLLVERRETTQCRLIILGFDLADLDADGSQEDLAVQVEVKAGKKYAGATRVVLPDGSIRVVLSNGGWEYLLPGGLVRREEPDGTTLFRRDHDLDGVPDENDPDFRRLKPKPEKIEDESLLSGRAFPPLVKEAKISSPIGDERPQDLVLFTAVMGRDFVAPATEVVARLYAKGQDPTVMQLRDDGGAVDLLPDWPGHQPSGDKEAGDGIYSHLLPLDAWSHSALFNREAVVTAVDSEGRASNRYAFFLYPEDAGVSVWPKVSGSPEKLFQKVRRVELLGRSTDRGGEISARFQASSRLSGVIATLVGPRGFRRVLAPAFEAREPNWIQYSTEPAPLGSDGLYFLIVGVPGSPVFYAGQVLSQESLATRTGG